VGEVRLVRLSDVVADQMQLHLVDLFAEAVRLQILGYELPGVVKRDFAVLSTKNDHMT
jgi:hypothetical protein